MDGLNAYVKNELVLGMFRSCIYVIIIWFGIYSGNKACKCVFLLALISP